MLQLANTAATSTAAAATKAQTGNAFDKSLRCCSSTFMTGHKGRSLRSRRLRRGWGGGLGSWGLFPPFLCFCATIFPWKLCPRLHGNVIFLAILSPFCWTFTTTAAWTSTCPSTALWILSLIYGARSKKHRIHGSRIYVAAAFSNFSRQLGVKV